MMTRSSLARQGSARTAIATLLFLYEIPSPVTYSKIFLLQLSHEFSSYSNQLVNMLKYFLASKNIFPCFFLQAIAHLSVSLFSKTPKNSLYSTTPVLLFSLNIMKSTFHSQVPVKQHLSRSGVILYYLIQMSVLQPHLTRPTSVFNTVLTSLRCFFLWQLRHHPL